MLSSHIRFAHFTSSSLSSLRHNSCSSMSSSSSSSWIPFQDTDHTKSKKVWIWTKNKQVITAAVERGWNTFIFPSHLPQLASDCSCNFYSLFFSPFHSLQFNFILFCCLFYWCIFIILIFSMTIITLPHTLKLLFTMEFE